MAIIKSYVGSTQKEAFDKVKAELGNEAVIINTRKIRKKGFGIFKKKLIEMTAVLDEPLKGSVSNEESLNSLKEFISENESNKKLIQIEDEILKVSNIINKVYNDVDLLKSKELNRYSTELRKIVKRLIKNGVSEDNAITIINKADELIKNGKVDKNQAVVSVIKEFLGEASAIKLQKNHLNTIVFFGPTGVGKTTTIAKIAALFSLKNNAKVGLITEDTYRIGAVEQLKIYADILSIPLEVAYDVKEIKKYKSKMQDMDLILIDTAGKSPFDKTYHKDLKKLIKESEADEVYLVISSTTDYEAAKSIIKHYSFIENYKLLFTKLDECQKWGNILNIKMLTDYPISYLTVGQNVAGDFIEANPDLIIDKVFDMGVENIGSGTST